jgi:hypothetical protein
MIRNTENFTMIAMRLNCCSIPSSSLSVEAARQRTVDGPPYPQDEVAGIV